MEITGFFARHIPLRLTPCLNPLTWSFQKSLPNYSGVRYAQALKYTTVVRMAFESPALGQTHMTILQRPPCTIRITKRPTAWKAFLAWYTAANRTDTTASFSRCATGQVGDWTQEMFRLSLENPRMPLWISAAQPSVMENTVYFDNGKGSGTPVSDL